MTQPPPPPVAAAPPAKGKRRKGLMILGIILLVVGFGGGAATAAKAMSNYKEAVRSLARAPVGCTTTLVFDKPARFTIYAETQGKLGALGGDCKASGTNYNHPADKLPKVSLTLVNSNGDAVTLDRGVSASYDIDGYTGTAIRTMKITQAGTYRLGVESTDSDFAVSIGKNPKDDSDQLLVIGGAAALGGLIFGLMFLLLGLRRRRPEVAMGDLRDPARTLPEWPPGPGTSPGLPPTAPPPPPPPGGYQPMPSGPATIILPGQPPVRLPDQPGAGFAPPTFAPPTPGASPPPGSESRPIVPPSPPKPREPQSATPPTAPSSPGWVVPDDDDAADA